MDESNDRSCTGAGRAGQKVCKSTSKRDIFSEPALYLFGDCSRCFLLLNREKKKLKKGKSRTVLKTSMIDFEFLGSSSLIFFQQLYYKQVLFNPSVKPVKFLSNNSA